MSGESITSRRLDHRLIQGESGETTLIQLARTGDRNAFDRLVTFLVAPLRGFLGRHVARQAVDDVVQETLLAAWTGLPRFEVRPQSTFDTWVYRIARNKAADWARRNASRSLRETPITPVDEERFPAPDTINVREHDVEIAALLQALSADQLAIIELYYGQGLTLAEVAEELDRNLSTVKYHFYRAQEILIQARRAHEEAQR